MRYILLVGILIWGNTRASQLPRMDIYSQGNDYNSRNVVTSINGNPIDFYLNHSKIDSNAKKFFRGEISISNNQIPLGLLDSVLTSNTETRPFYFLVFNQIVDLSDDEMVNSLAPFCLNFVQKYTCDFFNAFNQPDININVVKWTTYIGQTVKDRNQYMDFKGKVDINLKGNCNDLQDLGKSFLTEVRMCLIR